MRITIVGCGDAFGSGGRYHAASLIEIADLGGGGQCLLDCGATTMTALNAMGLNPNRIDLIFISHLHGDHFGGIPFLVLDAQWIRRRTRPLQIIGPPGTTVYLSFLFEALFAGSVAQTKWNFAWTVEEMAPGSRRAVAGFNITTAEVRHSGGAPATAVRLEGGDRTFVHSGDTEWTDKLVEIAKGADLLFLECFSVERMPNHLDYATLLAKRHCFDAKRIVLTHMGPAMLEFHDRVDRQQFELAEDGLRFDL